jgi:putative tryptophan/tyrosine transport system substrate-binding protein
VNRRAFITLLSGAAAAWPLAAPAQQPAIPVIGFINGASAVGSAQEAAAFRKGLSEAGYIEGQNVTVEYRWAEGQYNRLPALAAELVRRRVAVIAAPGSTPAALAVKAATATIPIVFGVTDDPVKLGLVANLARPGGNATGINFFVSEAVPKRLGLAARSGASSASRRRDGQSGQRCECRDDCARDAESGRGFRAESPGPQREQRRRDRCGFRRDVARACRSAVRRPRLFLPQPMRATFHLGGSKRDSCHLSQSRLRRSRRTDELWNKRTDSFREVGVYVGRILRGEKPADLPVTQPTKFELVINLQTARALGLDVPPGLLVAADEVIE